MTKEEILKEIESANKQIASWPEWKKNILIHSLSPTVSIPRKPVINK